MAYAAYWLQKQKKVLPPKLDNHEGHSTKTPFYTAPPYYRKSQPGQATPKPAAQVSTVKPAQFETSSSGSAMATKPGEVTAATGGSAGRGVTVGGSATAGAETAPVSQVKAPTAVPSALSGTSGRTTASGTTVAQTKGSPQLSAKSLLAGTTVKADANKAKTPLTSASLLEKKDKATPTQTKVQVEVPSAAAGGKQAPDADPFDALANILPSADTVVRPEPVYTGPEVKESGVTSEEAVRCGEREDTLPPGYRLGDMGPPPADWKPQEVPKPLSTDEALDSLSAGFMSSSAPPGPPQPKENVESACTVSTGPTNYSNPPADKKPKIEKASGNLAGITATPFKKTPPTEKKIKNPSVSLDAVSALSDLLPADVPKPESPKLRPEDMVSEDKHKEKDAVLVGERDDTIHPDYRFKKEDLEKLPAPKPEPTMGTGEALDILSGDFAASLAVPAVCTPAPPVQKVQTPAAGDFSLEAGLTSTTAKKVESSALPPAKTPAGSKATGGSMSQGALSALGDLLPADVPKPKEPELRPEDIVSEPKNKEEEAVRVGEREDSIHPNYRYTVEDMSKLPAPKPEPTMATGEALDILSGDFATSKAAPTIQVPVVCSTAPPTQSSADLALDALAGDFVTPSAAVKVESASGLPGDANLELAAGADGALDALSDTLKDIKPTPQPEPALPKNIVDEKKAVEERLIKMGERDDTLPPEYRPTEEDLKKMAEAAEKEAAKPKPTLDDKTALDLLSKDFSAAPNPPASTTSSAVTTKLESDPQKSMAGPVLQSLSDTLLPDAPEFKSKSDKPKGKSKSKSKSKKHAEEPSAADLPAQPSTDVVSTSTKKGGKR
ncbi:calpastatin isoform X12 [Salarias fasciatus]|uniref:calpastatin isoform X12 n=1 Tax=Salarias fasciatus TaxID=181472 RepID=UPI001176F425|nr:calpastatin isoform X12 [Salarias fasciatus]